MVDLIVKCLESGDYAALSAGVVAGLVVALLMAVLWLRVFRWIFALMGLRA